MKLTSYLILSGLFIITSCEKTIELTGGTPTAKASTTGNTFKVNEEVKFSFTGAAGLISFYSGEVLREYALREGRIVTTGPLNTSFTSAVTGGTQANQFAVLASTNFDGNYDDFSRIQAATWTDITSRFALGTTATFLASGVKDLADLRVAGKPLYIAFRYITKPQTANGAARTWMAQAFTMTSVTPVGTLPVANLIDGGFRIIRQIPDTSTTQRSSATTTRITLLGNTFSAGNDPQHEIWAISKAINPSEINLGPDRPIPVKGNSDPMPESYTYKFTKVGTYKVTFVFSNVNIDAGRETIQQFDITITP